MALPLWDFAPEPWHQQCAPCWISIDGVFSSFFFSNLSSHSCPPPQALTIPPPVSPLPFQNSPVFWSIYAYLFGGIINWGWWWGGLTPPFLKDWFGGREPAVLTNLLIWQKLPSPYSSLLLFYNFHTTIQFQVGNDNAWCGCHALWPRSMVVKISRLESIELRNRSSSAPGRAGTGPGVAFSC